jgi:hypothetical protein
MLAVLIGFAVFGVSSRLLFTLSGRDPHQPADFPFMLFGTFFGAFFALAAGYVVSWVAGQKPFVHAGAIALLMAFGAVVSLLMAGAASRWTMISTLVVSVPMVFIGAWGYARRNPGSVEPVKAPDPLDEI